MRVVRGYQRTAQGDGEGWPGGEGGSYETDEGREGDDDDDDGRSEDAWCRLEERDLLERRRRRMTSGGGPGQCSHSQGAPHLWLFLGGGNRAAKRS